MFYLLYLSEWEVSMKTSLGHANCFSLSFFEELDLMVIMKRANIQEKPNYC